MIHWDFEYMLAPYVTTGLQHGRLYFGFGSVQREVVDPVEYEPLLTVASLWKSYKTPRQVFEEARDGKHKLTDASCHRAIAMLGEGNFLCEKNTLLEKDERYKRPWLYYNLNGANPATVQSKLASSHVVILGCGGIGNFMATSLATAGVGMLTLVDGDSIELSNLTRQYLFSEADIGGKKIDVLRRELLARNPECKVDVLDLDIKTSEDLRKLPKADLIILSADTPGGLVWWMNDFSIELSIPFLNVGYVVDVAVWGPFVIPGITGCWSCQSLVAEDDAPDTRVQSLISQVNRGSGAASTGPVNMMASSGALLDVFRYLGQFGSVESTNKRIGIWTHSLRIETQNCALNANCQACGHKQGGMLNSARTTL
jgi:molybdopterin-synthase adenylyltransferase